MTSSSLALVLVLQCDVLERVLAQITSGGDRPTPGPAGPAWRSGRRVRGLPTPVQGNEGTLLFGKYSVVP